ncbi:hypothetical protein GW17_00061594 [Ensete ventricosum]|nr:hypothetical protein GW17_00061594 [Ensete ventricosum]
MPPCLLSRHCWFWLVCASTPAIVPDRVEMEHGWVEGGVKLGRSTADASELGSRVCAYSSGWSQIPTGGRVGNFYSGCYRSSVPEIFTASMAYHAVILLHVVCGPWGEACVLTATVVAC